MSIYSYKIGATLIAMESNNLEDMTPYVLPPKSDWTSYSKEPDLGNGTQRGGGYATVTWTWGYLTKAMRDKLKTYCPGKSILLYIQTKDDDQAYKEYLAVCLWPTKETRDHGTYVPFSLTFRIIQDVTPA